MHILDECKKHFYDECPDCGKTVRADQLHIARDGSATISYRCHCHAWWNMRVKNDLTVETIGS